MPEPTPQQEIELSVIALVSEQKELEVLEHELATQNEMFAKFIEAQKLFKTKSELIWTTVEQQMIKHDIKSLKGDWGSIGITERMNFTIDDTRLKPKYLKKVPDLKKIGDEFKLTGIAPAGVIPKPTKFLTKRIK